MVLISSGHPAFITSITFWTLVSSSQAINIWNISQETMCALHCHVKLDCWAYHFKDLEQPLQEDKPSIQYGHCIHVSRQELVLGDQIPQIPDGYSFKYVVQTNSSNHTQDLTHKIQDEEHIANTGFNQSITVGRTKVFLMEIIANHTYLEAMKTCLSFGGILPMESSDEFMEQMSNVSGNATAPRFISLAQEVIYGEGTKRLVWTLGLVKWEEGQNISRCSRCGIWDFNAGSIQWVKLNPVTKLYEKVDPTDMVSKYYCQYVEGNLATLKSTVASSLRRGAYGPEKVVDGDIFGLGSFWESTYGTPNGEWIVVDLGSRYTITNVLFLAESTLHPNYNRKMTVWVDGIPPIKGGQCECVGRKFICVYFSFKYGYIN
ncbi:hypothetical protein TCAL_14638 [Tigriopus californicus]|uniref:F5/8 type C domain-containing protein n=1 Tax=Tigriopus californicus TaxID=6832 RepID=A0A553P6P8_TIGCA|nr:hypothetical protein TCAL_14638 [Tigriopus californicus]